MSRRWLIWAPLALGLILFAALALGLRKPEGHVIASQLVGHPLPDFVAGPAFPGQPGTATADFRDGQPRLLNVFASWCVPCREEAPALMQLKAMGVELDGVAVHDSPADLGQFLATYGNPYHRLGLDEAGRAQIAFGSSGVPETFVIDGHGRVRYQHIGPIAEADIPKLVALLRAP